MRQDWKNEAAERWGGTKPYAEYEQRAKAVGREKMADYGEAFMRLFAEIGALKTLDPKDDTVQQKVQSIQDYISEHFYTCSDEVLSGLGKLYAADSRFTQSIDASGGEGTAAFAAKAIEYHCK